MARPSIVVSVALQKLYLRVGNEQRSWSVSTASNGVGELEGSGCTPRGDHRVAEMIGDQAPVNSVFVGRQRTGEIYTKALSQRFPDRDWILTRIIWLEGCEPGVNLGGDVDTYRRFIYIHGTPDSEPMGQPGSHGCIRMRNSDLIDLYDRIDIGTEVRITE